MPDDISLYRLESGLLELLDYRQERLSSTEDLPSEEELAALEGEIKAYITDRLPVKIDSIAAVVLWKERRLASLRGEKERIKRAINVESDDLECLKAYIGEVLALLPKPKEGSRKLVGATHMLSLRTNGGQCGLRVENWNADSRHWEGPCHLPEEFLTVTAKMPLETFLAISSLPEVKEVSREPNGAAIRAALEEECPDCGGDGKDHHEAISVTPSELPPCSSCGGTGHRGVESASLLPRGNSLKVT